MIVDRIEMGQKIIFSTAVLFLSHCLNAQIKEGQICHADAELSEYNYAGLWERFEDGWACNYWQFLPENEWEEVIIETEDGISQNDDGNKDQILVDAKIK